MVKIYISKKALVKLHYKQKKSACEIGRIYKCSFGTVANRMKEYGLKHLSRSIIQSKYLKKNFSGSDEEKAYMIGFRLGDLNIYKTASHSDVIVVRCHTTRKEQANLVKNLFKKYGKVTIGGEKSIYINCFLNRSFSFLLPKEDKVEEWISANRKCSSNFVAGYVDAEANIGVYDGRARFKVDSYDKNIIFWLFEWLLKNGVPCPNPIRIGEKGQVYNKELGYKYNQDLWRVRVSNQKSLATLFQIIKPLLRHKKRLQHLNKCVKNLHDRTKKH